MIIALRSRRASSACFLRASSPSPLLPASGVCAITGACFSTVSSLAGGFSLAAACSCGGLPSLIVGAGIGPCDNAPTERPNSATASAARIASTLVSPRRKMSGFLRSQRQLFIITARRAQKQFALRKFRGPDQLPVPDEFLEPSAGEDDLLERKPLAVVAYRLVAGRLGDCRAAVWSEYA